jgi:trimeric autotransporter adhesin
MLKRLLAGLALICLLPLSAQASWFLGTQARNAGGTISSPNMHGQSVTDGPLFKSYTTHGPVNVTITAKTGYTIRSISVNKIEQTLADSRYFSTNVQGWDPETGQETDQIVSASFMASTLSLAAFTPHGTVSPSRVTSITYGYTLTNPISFYFVPATGYEITNVRNIPSSPLVSHTPFSPGINLPVTVTFATGYVITDSIDLVAEVANATPYLKPILPQMVPVGTSGVSLATTVANNPEGIPFDYSWTYVSGPANTKSYRVENQKIVVTATPGPEVALLKPNFPQTSFTAPTMPGQYKFKVTASSAGQPQLVAMATVNVVGAQNIPLRKQCQNCHIVNDVGDPELFANWSSSAHKAKAVTCDNCHAGSRVSHPGTTSGNVCRDCHVRADGTITNHTVAIGKATCTVCHDPHSGVGVVWGASPQHFNNVSTAGYPASYITSNARCADCHDNTVSNAIVRSQWALSGHAATTAAPWRSLDFKTMSGCVQCHTTTGFIAYSTGRMTAAWGSAEDKTKEVLTCVGCHSDISAGTIRTVQPVQPFADDSFVNSDFGPSNICLGCHSGRNNGASIKVQIGQVDFSNTPFIPPHNYAAGAVLQGKGGYHFPGESYASYSSNYHRLIGMSNLKGTGNSGACISCHMSGSEKHLFQAVATDSSGNVTTISTTVCANCHGAFFNKALKEEQLGYRNALSVLKAMLENRGFIYRSGYPYFSGVNWGHGEAGPNVMGAAFNYRLLLSEQGAYVHNSAYAKKLLRDSIDLLYNGSVTGSVDSALLYLVAQGAITLESAELFVSYAGSNFTSP